MVDFQARPSPFGPALSYTCRCVGTNGDLRLHTITLDQARDGGQGLLISKVSEALLPATLGNHRGEGGTLDRFLASQPPVRFIINGGFNHYRKGFYDWPHQNFHVGDPVGLVKIREHLFDDFIHREDYGFLSQAARGAPWRVADRVDRGCKYILGSTPLLLLNGAARPLPALMSAPAPGRVTPPSVLWHGRQRHARTAVGTRGGALVFLLAESPGCTLAELQALGLDLSLDSLLNLDGGGSSQFRLFGDDGTVVRNHVAAADRDRVLGHVLTIFASPGDPNAR